MKIKFCGAAQYVTGSAHLITLKSGYKILLDCGLFQGSGSDLWEKNSDWLFKPSEIDCLILSHAHIDHTGRVPKLVKDGFSGEIYSTHATRSLCSIMLLDSAKIQERDVQYHNARVAKKKKRKRHANKKWKFREPLYTPEDVIPVIEKFVSAGYNRWVKITDEVEVYFSDAGHILGSASVSLRVKEDEQWRTVGFTGDIGRPDRPILRDPKPMRPAEIIISESTYGNRIHEAKPEQHEQFLNIIKSTCLEKKGKLIIPAFSVGRTQEIVYMLDQMETNGMLPHIPVYVDSPLAVNATTIFGAHPECFDNQLNEYLLTDDNPFGFNNLHYVKDVNTSKWLNEYDGPCIIISSSGMMNAGRVRHHLFHNIDNPENTFLIVGYCSPETPGGMLRNGVEEIKLYGEWKPVLAEVKIMDSFSAHADRDEILWFLDNQKETAKHIFLVHGEIDSQEALRDHLIDSGFAKAEIPKMGQEFEI